MITKEKKEREDMFDFNYDAFIIRPTNEENNEFIITLGDKIATPKRYASREEAEIDIKQKDWNLIVTLAITIAERAIENKLKEKEDKK